MGLFDVDDAYARVDACGDPLAKLQAMINWNGLEKLMNGITFDVDGNGGKGGRKPLCGLMMAKIMILQACNNLSDDRVEFLINDRLSYKRFGYGASAYGMADCTKKSSHGLKASW